MQLSFDPRDPEASASVLAIIAALNGSLAFDIAQRQGLNPLAFGDAPARDDRLDPAHAFDAPSPEAALAPLAPPALPVDNSAAATIPTPAPAPLPNPGGVEVDTRGFPWDARIHSGPANKRPKNADGSWRKGRGVDDATIATVEAELRAAMSAPAAPVAAAPIPSAPAPEVAAAPIPPAPAVPVAAPAPPVPAVAVPTAAPIAPPPMPVAAAMESGPVVAAPAASAPAATFADLMRKITGLQTSGHLTVEGTAEISASLGITGVRDLMARPDLIPSFDALLPVAA